MGGIPSQCERIHEQKSNNQEVGVDVRGSAG